MADRLHAMLRSRLRPGIEKRLRVFTGWLSVSAPAFAFPPLIIIIIIT